MRKSCPVLSSGGSHHCLQVSSSFLFLITGKTEGELPPLSPRMMLIGAVRFLSFLGRIREKSDPSAWQTYWPAESPLHTLESCYVNKQSNPAQSWVLWLLIVNKKKKKKKWSVLVREAQTLGTGHILEEQSPRARSELSALPFGDLCKPLLFCCLSKSKSDGRPAARWKVESSSTARVRAGMCPHIHNLVCFKTKTLW